MDTSNRTEQQVIAKQAAVSYLDRRVSELREAAIQVEAQKHAQHRSLTAQRVAAWWDGHPDITTDHLAKRATWLFWVALLLFVAILYVATPLRNLIVTRYHAADMQSAQDIALFVGGALGGLLVLCIVFAVYYLVLFLLPFIEIPKWRLEQQRRDLNEQRLSATRQIEQDVAREVDAQYAPVLASIHRDIAEAESQINRLKRDLDRLAMQI